MSSLSSRALADLLSAARMALPHSLAEVLPASTSTDPLAVAEAVAGSSNDHLHHNGEQHIAHLPDPAPDPAVLARSASSHLRSILPSYARDQAPTPFLVAAGDPRCPQAVKDKLRARSAAINAATEANRGFVLELVDLLESPAFTKPTQSPSPDFYPMSRFVPTVESLACKPGSYDSVETLMGHLSRDWSTEHDYTGGKSYDIILRMMESHVPKGGRVLLPGAGLGRLAFDLAKRGYKVEMNDCSPVMAAIAHLMLSHIRQPRPCFPFLHRWKNLLHGDERDQLTSLEVPNLPPGQEAAALRAKGLDISPIDITLGDFGKLYSTTPPNDSRIKAAGGGGFDAVVCSFFIDKSNSDTWQALLEVALPIKPGGVLINAGPLAWKGEELDWVGRNIHHGGRYPTHFSHRRRPTHAHDGRSHHVLARTPETQNGTPRTRLYSDRLLSQVSFSLSLLFRFSCCAMSLGSSLLILGFPRNALQTGKECCCTGNVTLRLFLL